MTADPSAKARLPVAPANWPQYDAVPPYDAGPRDDPAPPSDAGPGFEPAPRYGDAVPAARADPFTQPVRHTQRALIGDQIRIPAAWCEMSSCISRHADPDADGEADVRARAIAAGWRVDGFGRLACPACQQTDATFRGTQPVVRWDRRAALTMTALLTAGLQDEADTVAPPREETQVIAAVAPPAAFFPVAEQPAAAPPHSHRDRGRHRRGL